MNTVLCIDYGTQSVRVSVIDSNGNFLALEQEKYDNPYFSIKPGYAEQDPDYFFNAMCKAAKRLDKKHPDLMKNCLSISSTCFRDTAVLLDENYKPIRPCFSWLDQRNIRLDRKIPKLYEFIFWLIGMKNAIVLNRKRTPALWMQENEIDNWNKVKYYVPMNIYLNYRLTGVLNDSPSNWVGHFPVNFKNGKKYSKNALKGCIYGVDPNMIPTPCKVGNVIGTVSKEANELSGIPKGLKYVASGYDKSCEALGCGAITSDYAHISYGTAASIAVVSKKYFEPEPFLPAYKTCYPGYYSGEVQIYRGYWMITWFKQNFVTENELKEAKTKNLDIEEVLNDKIKDIQPGSNGLLLQPYWGPGLHRPLAKGSIIGFYDVHSKYHLYRAIIEGIGYALREGLESIQKQTKKKINYITVSGGGSKSDVICQITADIFGIPVLRNNTYESTSLGCAMSQFISLKVFKDVEEAKKNIVQYTKTFYPTMSSHDKYEELFKIYKKIYPSLKSNYKELYEYQKLANEE